MSHSYLDTVEIQTLTEAAVSADVFQFDRRLWLEQIQRGFVSNLVQTPIPLVQFKLDLSRMNDVERLADGSVPLAQFLGNIARLLRLSSLPEAAVFERVASQIGNRAQGVKLAASAAAAPEVVHKEAIVHQDDTLGIGFLSEAIAVARSVARIVVPRFENGTQRKLDSGGPWLMRGTGWLVKEDLLITNHHVINARDAREMNASAADFDLQACGSSVEFDLDSDRAATQTFTVQKLEAADATLDYALLRLAASTNRAPLSLGVDTIAMTPSTYLPVNIIQHPRGQPKRIAFRNNLMSGADTSTIRYFTDTDFGSSGAPVCNDNWRVVALHCGAESVQGVNFQGKSTAFVNFGTQTSRLLADLKQRFQPLYNEILSAQGV